MPPQAVAFSVIIVNGHMYHMDRAHVGCHRYLEKHIQQHGRNAFLETVQRPFHKACLEFQATAVQRVRENESMNI